MGRFKRRPSGNKEIALEHAVDRVHTKTAAIGTGHALTTQAAV